MGFACGVTIKKKDEMGKAFEAECIHASRREALACTRRAVALANVQAEKALGEACVHMDALKKTIEALTAENSTLTEAINAKDQELGALRGELASLQEQIANLQKQIDDTPKPQAEQPVQEEAAAPTE